MKISYAQYLRFFNMADSRFSWIVWKVDICHMEPTEAIKMAFDSEWGYEPLPTKRP